ncbi:prepilin-type N-terminal cleavage/methylation domain-containing protein [Mixta intestinalis]|uniref:Prepilin peptidase-dependent protein A n=1 Tax=Mixta intestinalis TaxID=1615494 RepID=A0A6P1Q018_9GAMM|nr:prepilin-type N-terminal cleavage/methylation domain-containing protein [Mixta intestinalis]QHM72270.1 hypothetical protein C7M51_02581 [Mixta intestinalis]
MKKDKFQGFTLLEVLITLTIVGLLSIAALTGWQQWQQQQRMRDTALQLQQFLHSMRVWAGWHNQDRPLWLLAGDRWCLGSGAVPPSGCRAGQRMQLLAPHSQVHIFAIEGKPGFYGRRNVARAGHILFGEGTLRWRIIISARGRIRLCKASTCL